MSIEQVSNESIQDSTFSLPPVQEATPALQEKQTATQTPRASKETMRKAKADLVHQKNLQGVLALPPWAQTAAEKKAIENDPRLKELLGDEAIKSIEKTDSGYTVFTENHKIDVAVKYLPMDYCGPAKFELEFGEKTPLSS